MGYILKNLIYCWSQRLWEEYLAMYLLISLLFYMYRLKSGCSLGVADIRKRDVNIRNIYWTAHNLCYDVNKNLRNYLTGQPLLLPSIPLRYSKLTVIHDSTFPDAESKTGEVKKVVDADLIEKMGKLFQCSVCLNLPLCHIYQCKKGHLICKDCHSRLTKPISCPSCRVPMINTPIRSRAAENVSFKIDYFSQRYSINRRLCHQPKKREVKK